MLNEIYWMANDTQLKSAIETYLAVSKLMKKAELQKRKFVAATQQIQTNVIIVIFLYFYQRNQLSLTKNKKQK